MPWLSILVTSLEGMMPPSTGGEGCSLGGQEHSASERWTTLLFSLTWGYLPIRLPPFCLNLPTMTQFCNWLHSFWGSLSTSINRYRHHSLCLTYVFLPKSEATSHYLWSSPIHSGCSSRCPWQKLQLPVFLPQGSFTGRSLGDCLTTFLL